MAELICVMIETTLYIPSARGKIHGPKTMAREGGVPPFE